MTLGAAALLLLLAIDGMIAVCVLMRSKKVLRRGLLLLLSLASLVLIGYIVLTLLFVSAVSGQPPA